MCVLQQMGTWINDNPNDVSNRQTVDHSIIGKVWLFAWNQSALHSLATMCQVYIPSWQWQLHSTFSQSLGSDVNVTILDVRILTDATYTTTTVVASNESSKHTQNIWVIIVVALVNAAILLLVLAFCMYRRKSKSKPLPKENRERQIEKQSANDEETTKLKSNQTNISEVCLFVYCKYCIYVHICIYVCVYVYMYVYMYVYEINYMHLQYNITIFDSAQCLPWRDKYHCKIPMFVLLNTTTKHKSLQKLQFAEQEWTQVAETQHPKHDLKVDSSKVVLFSTTHSEVTPLPGDVNFPRNDINTQCNDISEISREKDYI
ncbi:hypothetical protein RFI_28406 [Reticulomyxa filosa]|uniref:Uncharacterized protein n=1 Tax=Reticulomyxa filosa TaxID=46433 RepID=X6M5S8_RETFI|nr:hypothetical protein RFI_28406 [Reticulomyxa filosa]|eukprot:ETO08981.1 hypothetical protein RFI_28406 [Reticulomyxa filosa]